MNSYDVVQIVDVYPYYHERGRQTMKKDPDAEAQSLSMLVKPLGRNVHKIALVAPDDDERRLAYRRSGYETILMHDRDTELTEFILQMESEIKDAPPKHVVLVSDDPDFVHLCNAVAPHTDLAVWANGATAPRVLKNPKYGWRPLEELLPDLKVPRIDVRIDLENIFIGLVQRGWRPNLVEMMEAIHQAMKDLGEITTVTGYADFDELNRHHGPNRNWQRELTLANAESRYVVNKHGKNTADMKIADDIRTLVEHDTGAIDIIGLATMDRDFRHIVDTAQRRGKKVVVLGLEGALSRELEGAASEVRYLDKFLKLASPSKQGSGTAAPPQREDATLMMRVAALMHRNHWRFVYRNRLEQEFGQTTEGLRKLITEGWLTPSPGGSVDGKGLARTLEPNPNNTAARGAHYLARWIPVRLDYCLNQRGMPYVDSNFLANGMARDRVLTEMGVGQTRVDAESWLKAAACAGLIEASQQEHPQDTTKLITTWRLPQEPVAPPAAEEAAERRDQPQPASSYLRELLTQGLSDGELTQVLFDNFREVHREVDGAPKVARIQALLDYVERRTLSNQLLAAIRAVNPTLGDEPRTELLAA